MQAITQLLPAIFAVGDCVPVRLPESATQYGGDVQTRGGCQQGTDFDTASHRVSWLPPGQPPSQRLRVRERTTSAGLREPPQRWWPPVAQRSPTSAEPTVCAVPLLFPAHTQPAIISKMTGKMTGDVTRSATHAEAAGGRSTRQGGTHMVSTDPPRTDTNPAPGDTERGQRGGASGGRGREDEAGQRRRSDSGRSGTTGET